MVVAHPRLNDQVVEVPPAKGWTLGTSARETGAEFQDIPRPSCLEPPTGVAHEEE